MLSIFATTDLIPVVEEYLASAHRLHELVEVHDLLSARPAASAHHLLVRPRQGITQPIDWHNAAPPYLLPEEIALSQPHLLALLFARLGNYDQARSYLADEKTLLLEIDLLQRLQYGIPTDPSQLTSDFQPFEEYRFCHNSAILHHYAATEHTFDPNKTHYFYLEAIKCAPNGEYAAFSAKHFASFLLDMGDLHQAEQVLQQALPFVLSDDAGIELRATLCNVWMKKLAIPYDTQLLDQLKTTLWEVLTAYQQQGRAAEAALTLVDAAQIAHYANSFTESLGYINQAVDIFAQEELPELLAKAHYQRAMLLYTWAKNGNPQFFKGALDSFKEAAKVFNREAAPEVFAEMQQYLGIIYAEMPDEALKRSMWAAISSSSFHEALAFYTKERYPYEYARVCNHYGNALTKYPPAVHTDNFEKALFYYQEALHIRTAEAYPHERAVTLLNYVEACWGRSLEGDAPERQAQLLADMQQKAREALQLAPDAQVREEAEQQLSRLDHLRQTLAAEPGFHA